MDYFTIFGLPFSYSIDIKKLTYRYKELQRHYHPDRLTNQIEGTKEVALQQTIIINTAYEALKHPLKRAEYMLILCNIDIKNEKHIMHDTAFLIQHVALCEELSLIENSEQPDEELALFSSSLTKTIRSYLQEVEKKLNKEEWVQAADIVRKLRFLYKLQERLEELEERLLNRF